MNIVNMSIEMKNPNTPVDRSANHRKKFLGSGSIFHDAKVPANTMIEERRSMSTEMPSTPTARCMLRGSYHIQLPVKSISLVSPAARSPRNSHTSHMAMPSSTVEQVTITVRMAFILLLPQHASPAIMMMGTTTNQIKKFENIIRIFCDNYN